MHTLKEILAEPQTMYDGGVVRMQDGGGVRHLLKDQTGNYGDITSGSTTMKTEEPIWLSPKQLQNIPGAMGEEEFRSDVEGIKYKKLRESIEEKGYRDYEGNPLTTDPIKINVNVEGKPFITEGNHRLIEAIESNRDSIPVEITYLGGSENIEGQLNPDLLEEGVRVLKGDERGGIRLSSEEWKKLLGHAAKIAGKVGGKALGPILGSITDASPVADATIPGFEDELIKQAIKNSDFYHGTTATELKGGKFKASKEGVLGQAFYVTPDTEYARRYTEGEGGNIHPVKVNIKNPLIVRIKGRFHEYTQARVLEELGVDTDKALDLAEKWSEELGGDVTTQFKSRARKQGYDSIILVNDEINTIQEIAVFDIDKVVSKFKPMYDGGMVQASAKPMYDGGLV
jgi:hypothetical protein